MADTEFIEQLRRDLPTLLREHPEVRHERWGMMLEAFPSRQELMARLDEMHASREDTNQRFKVQCARQKLGREVIPFILALSMDTKAEEPMRSLGIRYRVRATVSR